MIDLPAAVQAAADPRPGSRRGRGEEIAEELGRLPLALEQAAAYLDRSGMPPRDYLEPAAHPGGGSVRARPGQRAPRHDRHAVGHQPCSASAAEDPAAVVLLELCAYLAPEPIPLDLFSLHADLLPEPLSSAAADQLAFNEVIGTLVDYSLAKRTQPGLQLHRLVQGVIRARHAITSRGSPARGDCMAADGSVAREGDEMLGVVLGLLRADAPGQITGAPQDWPRWAVLLPHVLAATSHFDIDPPGRGRGRCCLAAGSRR